MACILDVLLSICTINNSVVTSASTSTFNPADVGINVSNLLTLLFGY
ncbi:MAG: hypothetical protein H6579_02905 [Chitinophagales bacterium]|nr:hypothetical protein [Chitinophagales bacterium]